MIAQETHLRQQGFQTQTIYFHDIIRKNSIKKENICKQWRLMSNLAVFVLFFCSVLPSIAPSVQPDSNPQPAVSSRGSPEDQKA